jgi:hypothetical protein
MEIPQLACHKSVSGFSSASFTVSYYVNFVDASKYGLEFLFNHIGVKLSQHPLVMDYSLPLNYPHSLWTLSCSCLCESQV